MSFTLFTMTISMMTVSVIVMNLFEHNNVIISQIFLMNLKYYIIYEFHNHYRLDNRRRQQFQLDPHQTDSSASLSSEFDVVVMSFLINTCIFMHMLQNFDCFLIQFKSFHDYAFISGKLTFVVHTLIYLMK